VFQMHVASVYVDIAKVDRDVAYITIAIDV
jgi:hypothetical protein